MYRLAAILKRCGPRAAVERYRHKREQQQNAGANPSRFAWTSVLHGLRLSPLYPVLAGLLALISAGTGLYPFGPVLAAFVAFAPERWRSIYLAACLGSAAGSMVLAHTVQIVGGHLIAEYFPGLEHSQRWISAERWMLAYGPWGLAGIAALPLPQLPPLLILALAKTPTALIGLAILAGKLLKYGVYVLSVQMILMAIQKGLRRPPKNSEES